jgi:hypothetical protein
MARKQSVRPGFPRGRGHSSFQTYEAVEITDPVEQARVDRLFDQAELDDAIERHGGAGAKPKPRLVRILYYELPADARFELLTQLTAELPPGDHRRFVAHLSAGTPADGAAASKRAKRPRGSQRQNANDTRKQRRGA